MVVVVIWDEIKVESFFDLVSQQNKACEVSFLLMLVPS